MTFLSKTTTLAGGLAAALLLSTAMASAAPVHGPQTQDVHRQTQDRAHDISKTKMQARRDENRQHERAVRDSRPAPHTVRVAYDQMRYGDRDHRPPLRVEHRGRAPHAGRHWRAGHWYWHHGGRHWLGGQWAIGLR